ncbi:unnamed protein product [Pneumocystis jirovecii]|uniref:Ubiquinone biosynthesis O-methyltransferase, mitochondrial n=1 Tax=Pneumocystis jirovecii TaxID=42068 RepID=L0PA35_PNEJI|nr:unnamed protein product [Pneumocystis jirovecii]
MELSKHFYRRSCHYLTEDSIWTDEQKKFDQLATGWWDPNGPFALLHRMNTARITYLHQQISSNDTTAAIPREFIRPIAKTMPVELPRVETKATIGSAYKIVTKLIPKAIKHNISSSSRSIGVSVEKWLTGWRILDVGCGGGILAESLARLGGNVVGIDMSKQAIQEAQRHQRTDPVVATNPIYHVATAEQLLQQEQKFDLVMAMEVLEHVRRPDILLETLCGLLAPGGRLVISTIERTALSFMLTIFLAEHLLQLVPKQTHVWHRLIRRSDIKNWLANCSNVSLVDCRGVIYLPWYRTWKIMDPGVLWTQQCNYFVTIQKKPQKMACTKTERNIDKSID